MFPFSLFINHTNARLIDVFLQQCPLLFNFAVNKALKTAPLFLAVIVLRVLLRRAPKKILPWLWGVVALGLLLPLVRIPSIFSLVLRTIPVPTDITYEYQPRVDTGIAPVSSVVNRVLANFDTHGENSVNPLQMAELFAALIWTAGIFAIGVYAAVSTIRLYKRLRNAQKDPDSPRIRTSNACPAPFIWGIFRPCIYLPCGLSEADRTAVLLHENAHIRRGDHIWKLVGFLLAAYYWFDPLVWVGYCLLSRDIEFACDECVICGMDVSAKKSYAEALLHCSLLKPPGMVCPTAFGETAVKARIASVARYQSPSRRKMVLCSAVIPLAVLCFLTDPDAAHHIPEAKYFESAILESTPSATNAAYRACSYIILDSDFERFYDRQEISYHYAAVLVREYTYQNGEPAVSAEHFYPAYIAFKKDRFLYCDDMNAILLDPRYDDSRENMVQDFRSHFHGTDPTDESWRNTYDTLSAGCQPITRE